jgi:maleylpyruvate isomerase
VPRGDTVTADRTVLDQRLAWQDEGTRLVQQAVATADLTLASALPGWTRAHLVAHLARNADALVNLLAWAATGEPHPMYPAPGQRERDIETGATRPPDTLRADLLAANARLAAATGALPAAAWSARVRSARGRDIPAGDVPWLRVREVWLHLVDFGGRWTVHDLPADLVPALLTDVTATLGGAPDAPSVALVAHDESGRWPIGTAPTSTVTGPPAALLGWATGRTSGTGLRTDGPALPALPRWL